MSDTPARPSGLAALAAWAGGALFVASLLYYAYFFFVTLGRPVPPGEARGLLPAIAVNLGLFGAFAAHHSVMARSGAKAWLAAHLPPALERTAYNWVASLMLIGVCTWWWRVPGVLYALDGAGWGVLTLVQVAGVAITLGGAAVLDPLELGGIRQARGERLPLTFRISGPFRLVRHPIYLGWLLMVFGAPVMTVDRLIWAVISSAYLIVAIPWEERSLIDTFGQTYRDYQQQVRWRIVPGLY
ncbi:MAG: methyltransferase [Vicinamibacterales bacterium]|nr:methyltransferase [Vicinamibacterales bacterium]